MGSSRWSPTGVSSSTPGLPRRMRMRKRRQLRVESLQIRNPRRPNHPRLKRRPWKKPQLKANKELFTFACSSFSQYNFWTGIIQFPSFQKKKQKKKKKKKKKSTCVDTTA